MEEIPIIVGPDFKNRGYPKTCIPIREFIVDFYSYDQASIYQKIVKASYVEIENELIRFMVESITPTPNSFTIKSEKVFEMCKTDLYSLRWS